MTQRRITHGRKHVDWLVSDKIELARLYGSY